MAKRRRRFTRRTARISSRRSYKRRSSRSVVNPLMKAVYGAGYGFGRKYVSNLITPFLSGVLGPAGNLADNIGMGAVAYFLAKSKNKMFKNIGTAGLYIEGALAGNDVGSLVIPSVSNSKATINTSSTGYSW